MDTEEIILKPNHRAKRILYFSKERNIDLEKYHFVKYLDHDEITRLGYDGTMAFIKDFNPEIVIEREFNDGKSLYDDLILWIKANIQGVVTAIWLIDSHCIYSRHEHLVKDIYDFAFVAIYKYYQKLSKLGNKNVYWLPLCYPGKRSNIIRRNGFYKYEISFVGRFNPENGFVRRYEFLQDIKKVFGDRVFITTDYENMEKILKKSFISLNCSLAHEMNFRIFEIMAHGAELVTDSVEDMDLIKDFTRKFSVYSSSNIAIMEINDLLNGKVERDMVKTQMFIKNHHSLIHRLLTIVRTIETGIQEDY